MLHSIRSVFRREVRLYATAEGREPFSEWFDSLQDEKGKGIILARLARVRAGNLGDCRPVGQGIHELRVFFGPGYRVYFGQDGKTIVMLLIGGDKSTQKRDIVKALEYWGDYRRRQYEEK